MASTNIGKLVAVLSLDGTPFTKGLTGAQRKLRGISNDMKRMGTNLTAGVTVPLGLAGAAAVKMASDVEETANKFNTVFGESSAATRAWAKDLSKATNRSRFSMEEYLASVQDTLVPMGIARDQAAGLSKSIVELANDVGSFQNTATGDVVEAFTSALVGNQEAVRKYGIAITQSRLDQELWSLGVKVGVQNASEQQKVLARLSLLFRDTSDAQGDAARTANDFANRLKGVKARAQVFGVVVGNQLKPALNDFLGAILDATEGLEDLDEQQVKAGVAVAGFAAAIGPAILATATLAGAVALLGGPMTLAVVGVTALTAAIVVYRDEIKKTIKESKVLSSLFGELGRGFTLPGNKKNRNFMAEDALSRSSGLGAGGFPLSLDVLEGLQPEQQKSLGFEPETVLGPWQSAVKEIADTIAEALKSLSGQTTQKVTQNLEKARKAIQDKLTSLQDSVDAVEVGDLAVDLRRGAREIENLGLKGGLGAEEIAKFTVRWKELKAQLAGDTALAEIALQVEAAETAFARIDLTESERQILAGVDSMRELATEAGLSAASIEDFEKRYRTAMEGVAEAGKQAAETFSLSGELAQSGAGIVEGILSGSREAEDVLDALKDAGISTFAKLFAGALEEKLKFDDIFEKNFLGDLGGVLQDFAALAIDSFKSLFSSIAKGLNSLTGSGGGGGGGGSILGLLGTVVGGAYGGAAGASAGGALGGALGGAVGFASGGIVSSPTLGLVGESPRTTPEVIAPLSDLTGMIQKAVAGGGGDVTVNVINESNANASVNDKGQDGSGRRIIEVLVRDTVTRDIINGGPISSALDQTRGTRRVGTI